MTKKIRWVLIIFGLLIFLSIGPWLVLYTQGIKFDFQQKKFVKTGGLFLQVKSPIESKMYINGKLKKTTSFLSNSIFVKNLLPKKYKVEIKKQGYSTWQKELLVSGGLVEKAENIILFKTEPNFNLLSNNVQDFLISKDQKYLIYSKKENNVLSFWLLNTQNNEAVKIAEQSAENPQALTLEQWDQERKLILFQEYRLIDLSKPGSVLLSSKLLINIFALSYNYFPQFETSTAEIDFKTQKISFSPWEENKVIALSGGKLLEQQIDSKTKQTLKDNVIWFETLQNEVFYLNNNGIIIKLTADKKEEAINKTPIAPNNQNIEFSIMNFGKMTFFIFNKNELYLLNKEREELEKIADIQCFAVSPGELKLALAKNNEIWLWQKNLEENKNEFINRFWKNIANLDWLDENYLIFSVGDEIKTAETDSRDNINTSVLKIFKEPNFCFNFLDKKIYILSEGNFYISERIMP